MTWEEIIISIRKKNEYSDLIRDSYLDENLQRNIELYKSSKEFKEILRIIKSHLPENKTIKLLDVGAGNGIASISFGLEGIEVDALDPDKSDEVGIGAIKKMINFHQLKNVTCSLSDAENYKTDKKFDIVFARQSMHHANDLKQFVKNIVTYLKPGGILITIRDHVVSDRNQLKVFLRTHPLHKFYGGENAFTLNEYKSAMNFAGLKVKRIIGPRDSDINSYPIEINCWEEKMYTILRAKIGVISKIKIVRKLYLKRIKNKYNEPGRLFSFVAIKYEDFNNRK